MLKFLVTTSCLVAISQAALAAPSLKTLVCAGKVTDYGSKPAQTFQLSQALTVEDPTDEPGVGSVVVGTKVYNDEISISGSAIQSDAAGLPKTSVVIRLEDSVNQVGLLSGTGGGSLLNSGYVPEGEGTLLNYTRVSKDRTVATLSVIVECKLK